mmetsp:Transcript_150115/g.279848  ORF Transcript_150115/g.279848 Transcript_150115/m.279848 type:complete len:325 (-) Transcript_150115:2756-3730(-)
MRSTSRRSSNEHAEGNRKPHKFRTSFSRVDSTCSSSGLKSTFDESRSDWCLCSAENPPWRKQIKGSKNALKVVYDSSSPAIAPQVLIMACPRLSMPGLMTLAKLTPVQVLKFLSLSYIELSLVSTSAISVKWPEISGICSGQATAENPGYSSAPKPGISDQATMPVSSACTLHRLSASICSPSSSSPNSSISAASADPGSSCAGFNLLKLLGKVTSSPRSSFSSYLINSRQPRMTSFTWSASEEPKRSMLEISQTPVPLNVLPTLRTCSFSTLQNSRKPGSAERIGRWRTMQTRRLVPTLAGHVAKKPRRSVRQNLYPSCSTLA